jgi:hypothetical protein
MNASVRNRLEREFRDARDMIYASGLPWEKKMLRLHRLRLEYDRKIRQAEKEEEVA